jgi:NADH-quinone oxidoreductase subunit N
LPLAFDWQQMLGVLAVASLFLGNLAAIAQTNLKRMLAYSTISQMGFVLLGMMSGVVNGNVIVGRQCVQLIDVLCRDLCADDIGHFGVIMLLSRAKVSRAKRSPISPV